MFPDSGFTPTRAPPGTRTPSSALPVSNSLCTAARPGAGWRVARLAKARVDAAAMAGERGGVGGPEPVALGGEGAGQLIGGLLVLRLYRHPTPPFRTVEDGRGW